MADRKLILDILARDRASRPIERVGDAADGAGTSLEGMAKDAAHLDDELGRTQKAMQVLTGEMARLDRGSARFKELRKEFGALSRDAGQLGKMRKVLGDVGADGAEAMSMSFSQRIGPLLAKAPVSAPLVGAVAAAAPAIGAAVGAAVLSGLAAGTVGAGVAMAFRHPSVKAAGRELATDFESAMMDATADFVPATVSAIGVIRGEVRSLGPELRGVFAPAAQYVAPLTRGLTGFIRGVLPGLASGLRRAKPVVDALAAGFALVGEQTGEALEAIGDGSAGAAMALKDMLVVTAYGVRALGETVGFLSKMYGGMRVVASGFSASTIAELAQNEASARQMNAAFGNLTSGLGSYSSAAGGAAGATRHLTEAQIENADRALAAFDAETALATAIRDAGKAAQGASGGINLNTAAGLRNREALSKLSASIIKSVADYEAQHGATARSAQMQQQGYDAFLKAARGMGVTGAAARNLAKQLGLLPRTVRINVDTHYRMFGKPGTSVGGIGGQGFKGYSKGGPIEGPGPRGRDSVPILGAPGEGVLNLRGMAAVGGKRGLAALNKGDRPVASTPAAAASRGPAVAAAAQRAARSATMVRQALTSSVPVPAPAADRTTPGAAGRLALSWEGSSNRLIDAFMQGLRYEIRTQGGNVQAVLGTGA
ncbi:hypothetical protein GCM10010124_26230 [Pilimelia terevasa]|uniref:Uncharacterized protein n=1 Tax=Pilimelia terevasa TaxID=53372 RepID=A0A8J3BM25_9ACTN|nr:hypothetical protein [Pilimelia terevasa]GGK32191.1 hypothetical protein GCM10010124_26230 [Pilimelia terevasa]